MGFLNYAGLALGAYNMYQGHQEQKRAANMGNAQINLGNERLADARAQQARHEEIYGSLEKNLASYYTKLTPKARAERGLDRYEEQMKSAKDNVTKSMAQRGLTGSGIEGEANLQMEMQAGKDRANIYQQAEDNVRQEKLGFLGVGLGQSNLAQQQMAGAQQQQSQAFGNQQRIASQNSSAAGAGVGSMINGLMYSQGRGNKLFG